MKLSFASQQTILKCVDTLLGSIYGLTREQVDYVKAYDGKFRMDED